MKKPRSEKRLKMIAAMRGNQRGKMHGHAPADHTKRSPTYNSFVGMRGRCLYPSNASYPYYGARGIKICLRWMGKNGFINFLADMGKRPANKTLDRIDTFGDYGPFNCRWSTRAEQDANRRKS